MPELPRGEGRTICLRNKSEQVYYPYPFSMLLYRGQELILPAADELRKELFRREFHKRHVISFRQRGFLRYQQYRYHVFHLIHSECG